ncbi:hypothetical protein REI38_000824 [Salmonella enterica]|uniref:GspD-like N0 domain-containing protein n=1 Tax=Salmonella enterica TaxID=28901 RepID=A0A760RN84_SALER|nr:hypothetical protein [Salmonella enterica]ECI2239425.1 hypothetical protein [Salmonella enterica subsp. enterica]EDG7302018.1 hypothetical protein [Salmonella enterica subsp. enterica serovar Bareilly]EDP9435736.1 hypothetical protein [Salmonella enterica subsp. enterica serovar Irumu]EDY0720124.1 hypothetical protein [Salmonella enterica subsp. enterica]
MRVFLWLLLFCFSFCASAETVNMKDVPVREFVAWYSERSGQSIVVPSSVTGTVTVFNYQVKDGRLKKFFETVMLGLGYGVVPGDPALLIALDPPV